jgi:hypothetical protein
MPERTGLTGSLAAVFAALCLAVGSMAAAQQAPSGWTLSLEPYLWLAGADGTLRFELPPLEGGGNADVGLSAEDLSFAFMLTGEARKGDWSVVADVVYVDFDSEAAEVKSVSFAGPGGAVAVDVGADTGTSGTLTGTEWSLAAGYTLARGAASSFDVVAGVRFLTIEATVDWRLAAEVQGPGAGQSFGREGSLARDADLWDGVVGVRGSLGVGGGRWFVPFYADVGAGSSELTWQAVAGLGYHFAWGDVRLAWRTITYNLGDDDLLQSVTFSGTGIGVRFRI